MDSPGAGDGGGSANAAVGAPGTGLAVIQPPASATRARVCVRVITKELAERFAAELGSDLSHTVESAALASGVRPGTVREAIARYERDDCRTLSDEEVCEILVRAKADHIRALRGAGFFCAGKENRAGTSWVQWQLEVQAPKEHPRKQAVELTGAEGGPIATESTTTAVQYVITVPEDEADEEEGSDASS